MDKFKQRGVGSVAWYLNEIKSNPDRKGLSFLKDTPGAGQWDDIKVRVSFLVDSRYLEKVEKPGAPLSTRYRVTSFGHRYLEEHKADLMQAEAEVALGGSVEPPKKPSNLLGKSLPITDDPQGIYTSEDTVAERRQGDTGFILTAKEEDDDEPPVQKRVDLRVEKPVEPTDEKTFVATGRKVFEVSPAGVAREVEPKPRIIVDELAHMDQGSFEHQFRGILADVLIERYADQVTAKDILERMGGNS